MDLEGFAALKDERIAVVKACDLLPVHVFFPEQIFADFQVLWQQLTHQNIDFCSTNHIFVNACCALCEECRSQPRVTPDFIELLEGSEYALRRLFILGICQVLRKKLLCL